ncbi:MAG: sigma-70 family RNA polymerase sigma factor, partial [Proteobacteria bacterium]|nr:sigma-70 family RNA polymerase sigma factor [Pseudomonadota bacterium]
QHPRVRDPRAAHTWMLRIVTHRCRRLQRRQPVQSLETLLASGQEPVAPDATHAAETRLGIEAAMASLPSSDQEVLTLREMLSLSYEEIAASLAVPLGTVRSRLAKARQRLISALRGTEKERR